MQEYNKQQTYTSTPPRWAVWTLTLHGQHECTAHYHGETLAFTMRDRLLGEGRCAWVVDDWKEA
jgi:hypothetical protein|tara:strand:+ start:2699 stop:2890 length:192 start_codon:yes stop_codon:yes gene_type:complete